MWLSPLFIFETGLKGLNQLFVSDTLCNLKTTIFDYQGYLKNKTQQSNNLAALS